MKSSSWIKTPESHHISFGLGLQRTLAFPDNLEKLKESVESSWNWWRWYKRLLATHYTRSLTGCKASRQGCVSTRQPQRMPDRIIIDHAQIFAFVWLIAWLGTWIFLLLKIVPHRNARSRCSSFPIKALSCYFPVPPPPTTPLSLPTPFSSFNRAST